MRILCYGASNTWGYNPRNGSRFDRSIRWPGVLAECLGARVEVVEEGLNGRTVGSYEPAGSPYNGLEYLEPYLLSHGPFSLVVLFLGTNDLFADPGVTADVLAGEIAGSCRRISSADPAMRFLIVPPPPLASSSEETPRYSSQLRRSRSFASDFEGSARRAGCLFFDASGIVESSPIDGIHLEPESHHRLGTGLCRFLLDQRIV